MRRRQVHPQARSANLRHVRQFNVLLALIVGVLISLYTPYFLTTNDPMGVFREFPLTAIVSICMVIITGGIDLPEGSAMGLASLVTALCFDAGVSTCGNIAACLGGGVMFGFVNGALITVIGFRPSSQP
jgi:ribose transport system permease protein